MSKPHGSRPTATPPVRTLVLCPDMKSGHHARGAEGRLHEAVGLAEAIHVDIREALIVPLRQITPSTLFGSGKVAELAAFIQDCEIALVMVDHALTPGQQRELEKAWKAKVELAALDYQRSRLVKSWTHLERQRGGFGFLGGPGESQLEIDRRLIDKRMAKIREGLKTAANSRSLQRHSRTDPVVALVGYTNAGKSTLFNALTRADVVAEDMLFATLDPTMRRLELPSGRGVILSDTVGFISDLPTGLVAAFSATLEEVKQADVILHVRDASHLETTAQRQDVLKVLEDDLGIDPADPRIIEVLNKIDLLHQPERFHGSLGVSALTGQGLDRLKQVIGKKLCVQERHFHPGRTAG